MKGSKDIIMKITIQIIKNMDNINLQIMIYNKLISRLQY